MDIKKKPTMIMILDGFGLSDRTEGNAVFRAETPSLDKIFKTYPCTSLLACGSDVGLPDGQMGNSEVGHLNIGAGRIVYQELSRISKAIEDGSFRKNAALCKVMEHVKEKGTALHLLGLVSDGGVHSHISHLEALIEMASEYDLQNVYIHCFLDGRDVPPRCAKQYIEELQKFTAAVGTGGIVTISGRYYAMDRDKRYDRVIKTYDTMVMREGRQASDPFAAIDMAYAAGESDEFLTPTCINTTVSTDTGQVAVNDGDGLIMFNFRPDRAREITRAFVDPDFDGFTRRRIPSGIKYVCMTQYDAAMPNAEIAFPPEKLKNVFGQYISDLGATQLRIAETEKYAHVTFFFNGGIENPYSGEDRILVPSPKVATYDLQPEMSAYIVTERVLEAVASDKYDFIILNFANADMVGHTGIMEAAVKAVETLDKCVPQITDAILKKGGQVFLTADHGNADEMLDEDGNIVTSHSLNPVPFCHIAQSPYVLSDGGRLCDIAPTVLDSLCIAIPEEMTGKSLLIR